MSKKKSDKKEKLPPHLAGGRAKAGHGAHDVESPIVVNQGAGHHSGRPLPQPVSAGGDDYAAQAENGGGIGAGNDAELAQPTPGTAPFVPKFLRGAVPASDTE